MRKVLVLVAVVTVLVVFISLSVFREKPVVPAQEKSYLETEPATTVLINGDAPQLSENELDPHHADSPKSPPAEQIESILTASNRMIQDGRTDDALELLETAAEVDPDAVGIQALLCEIYLAKEHYPTAMAVASKQIEKNPQNASAYYQRAFANIGMDEYEEAIEDIGVFIDLTVDPEFRAHASELRKEWMETIGWSDPVAK